MSDINQTIASLEKLRALYNRAPKARNLNRANVAEVKSIITSMEAELAKASQLVATINKGDGRRNINKAKEAISTFRTFKDALKRLVSPNNVSDELTALEAEMAADEMAALEAELEELSAASQGGRRKRYRRTHRRTHRRHRHRHQRTRRR